VVISFRIARIRQVVQNHILSKRNDGLSDYPGKIFTGLKALDVGCGGGLLSESLARLGADVTVSIRNVMIYIYICLRKVSLSLKQLSSIFNRQLIHLRR